MKAYTDFRNGKLHKEARWMNHRGQWMWTMRPVHRQLIHKGRKP